MKNFLFASLAFLFLGNLSAQSDTEEIRRVFDEYAVHVINKDNTKLVEYLHPGLFDLAPKEFFIKMMDEAYGDSTININFSEMIVDGISEPVVMEGNKYALIDHNFDIKMQMLPADDSPEAKEENAGAAALSLPMFHQVYGEENVKFDEETVTFTIHSASETIAVNDEKSNGWKFLENKEDTKPLIANILPAAVLEKLAEDK